MRLKVSFGARAFAAATVLLTLLWTPRLFAQVASGGGGPGSSGELHLFVDPNTGQLFIKPGPGRVPVSLPVSALGAALAKPPQPPAQQQQQLQQVEQRQQALEAKTQKLEANAQKTADQVTQMVPAWQHYVDTFGSRMYIGAQFWADWAWYPHTSYGPQLLTQINPPGPGNGGYNSIDITRSYINAFFNPTDDWILRITPNLYRQLGGATNQGYGALGGFGQTVSGNYSWRLKYGYMQYTKIFQGVDALSDDSLIVGQQPEPLVPWEEDLYGFRYVNLVTWNMSMASTFPGITLQGPIRFGEQRLQYIDYNVGVFDEGSFHALEQADTKEAMARVSVYPFGARWRYDGLGITTFYDWGWGNVTPDLMNLPADLKGPQSEIMRLAEIVHYTTDTWQIAFEYDWGRNAWSPGNQFSASGPAQIFGVEPSTEVPSYIVLNQAAWANLSNALMNNGRSYQQGLNVFGHYVLGDTPFTLFGWAEQWLPATNVKVDPFDFIRLVAGISYQYNEYVRIALDYQSILYYHKQMAFPVSYAQTFGWTAPTGFTGSTVPYAVAPDQQTVMLNFEYAF